MFLSRSGPSSRGRAAHVQQWTAAQARRFGRGYGSSIYAAEARGDDREAGRLLDEFEARDATLSPALSRIFVEAYQAARWKRLPKGRRSLQEDLAALPVGSVVVQAGAPPHLREPLLKLTDVAFVPWRNGRLDASVKFAADPSMWGGLGAFAPFPYKRVEVVYHGADGVAWLRSQAGQRAPGRRAPAWGRRAPAAMRIGKTIYEIIDTTRVQTRRGAATIWKLRGPDGKEHKLERIDGRGQPYYKSSRWSRPHPIAAGEVRYLPATAGDRPKPLRPAREPVARGVQTHIVPPMVGEGGQHLVTVNPGAWVRLHGTREVWDRAVRGPGGVPTGGTVLKPYDLTFKLGDTAVNGSYNLTYTGVIESIGPKRILVVGVPVGRKSMDLRSFSFYNRDFDAGRIARENADTSMRI